MKMLKKLSALLLASVLMFTMGVSAFAAGPQNNENAREYQEYTKLVNDGTLGKDITFEYWQALKSRAAELENQLESSSEFSKVYDSACADTYSTYTMQSGDVFITNGTSSFGITGHAAIAITLDDSSKTILHISGPGANPSTISLSSWNSTFSSKGWTKIYRHNNSNISSAAATWAKNTYYNSNATYEINMDLASTDKTYCSKLVWQAYYYGPSSHCANGPTWGVRLPYDLPDTIHDLMLVKTYEKT